MNRRHFLNRMGLGAAAAPLVLGIGNQLIGRAFGQSTRRKMALFMVHGESFIAPAEHGGYTPPGIAPLALGEGAVRPPDEDRTGVAWPEFLAPLAPFREKMAIVDGLEMGSVTNKNVLHGWKYGVLSATGAAEVPSAASIDQHLAGAIGRDTPIKSLLFGAYSHGDVTITNGTFASGAGAALRHLLRPSLLLAQITGAKPGTASGPTTVLGGRLMDLLREDLRRLDRGLAAEEKAQLAEYLSSMESFQKKEDALARQLKTMGCSFPAVADAGSTTNMRTMFSLATLALRCGVTNVVGVTFGNSGNHEDMAMFGGGYEGHGDYRGWMRKFAPVSMGWVAQMLQDMGPAAADMTVTIVPANGVAGGGFHHGTRSMAAFVYNGSGTLRTGARFFRKRRKLADLYTTVAQAVGAPVEKFNGAGDGRIDELLA